MILVTLGTQDKTFIRLLEKIDDLIEKGLIKDQVVVQSGYTKYHSSNMEIFDLIPQDEFNSLMEKADIIITHGGVGSIISALEKGKKVIVVANLAPAKLCGEESFGMILASGEEQVRVVFLDPETPLGERVR